MLLLKIIFLFFTFLYNLKRYQKSRGGKNNKEPPRIFLSLLSLTAPWDQILSRDMSNDKDSQGIHLWYPAFYQKLNSWYSSIFGPQIFFSCLTNRPPLSRSLKFNSTRVLRWFSVLCIYPEKDSRSSLPPKTQAHTRKIIFILWQQYTYLFESTNHRIFCYSAWRFWLFVNWLA